MLCSFGSGPSRQHVLVASWYVPHAREFCVVPAHDILTASLAELYFLALQALYTGCLAMLYPGHLLSCHSVNAADAVVLAVKYQDLTRCPLHQVMLHGFC